MRFTRSSRGLLSMLNARRPRSPAAGAEEEEGLEPEGLAASSTRMFSRLINLSLSLSLCLRISEIPRSRRSQRAIREIRVREERRALIWLRRRCWRMIRRRSAR